MTRTYRIYVCTPDECLFKLDIEALSGRSAEAQVRAAFRDLPADATIYRAAA